jgi:anti-sigma-K factor RskA
LQTTIGSHVPEELLVLYISGRLPEQTSGELEEHMLMCESCQAQLDALDEHLRVGAQAAREIRGEQKKLKGARGSFWRWNGPTIAWAAVAAVVVCAAAPSFFRRGEQLSVASTEVSLNASRGGSQTLVSHAQAGNIVLNIDLLELPNQTSYHLQLVDRSGRQIWAGTGTNTQQHIRAAIPNPLASGQYWVRIFGQGGAQLREFGLEVE